MSTLDPVAGYRGTEPDSGREGIDPPGAAQVPAASAPELRTLAAVAVGTLVIAALYFGQDVLIPIVLAVMLSFVLSPLVNALQRLRLWRAPAVILSVIAALGILGLLGTLIASQAASLAADAPRYARTIEAKAQGLQGFAVTRLASVTRQFGGAKAAAGDQAGPAAIGGAGQAAAGARRAVPVEIVQSNTAPLTIARTILAPVLGPLETTIIVLIVAIFVLMQKEDLRDRFIRVAGSRDLHRTTRAMDDAGRRLSRYFLSQLGVNASFGVVIGIGLWLIGIPSPAMWGIMAGLLRFVPYIGSFLAAVAPAALGAAVDPGWTMAVAAVLLFAVVEPLTGYVVEPLLYGHSTGLSPVSVIVSAIFWTWLWGPIGLIMSTPLTLCLVVMGRHVKSLEVLDVLLGDRPALTPVESFYQRILANDPDEALAQAETLLANRPLADYYDAVVLQGLKLAVEDEARGTIDRAGAAAMTRSMLSVIGDLRSYAEPPAPADAVQAPAPVPVPAASVLCVAGHGPFDNAVAAMLVQLLGQQGIAVRTVGSGEVSRDAIATLDLTGVEVIAVSYLEVSGTPARLRYLVRRLRARAPQARIVVGLWPQDDTALADTEVQRVLGADRYVGSLAAAVGAVTELRDRPAEPAAA